MKRATLYAMAVTLAALAVQAQTKAPTSPTSGSDAGPFPPEVVNAARAATPPVVIGAQPAPAASTNTNAARPATMPARPAAAPTPAERQRMIERELDRAEREAAKAREQAAAQPAPVSPGAYDGTTNSENR